MLTKQNFLCSCDGMTIRGLAYIPEGSQLPAAIVSHGFMANYSTTEGYAEFLAGCGYAAFCFDFNGGCVHGESDNDTARMSVYTEVEDLKAVIAYVKGLPYIKGDGITLMGCSQGGFVSAITAAQIQEEIRQLILFYPALCIPDDARSGRMMYAEFDPHNLPDIIECGPMKLGKIYPQSVMETDAFEAIRGYAGPVLIVHGTEDKIVDCKYAVQAAEVYQNAELVLIQGGSHGFNGEYREKALHALEQFVKV